MTTVPYHEVPTLSVVSHNGMLLKRLGGYVAPSVLLGVLEQFIRMQNTAAIVAALASANTGSTSVTAENKVSDRVSCELESSKFEQPGPSALYDESAASCSSGASMNNSGPLQDVTSQVQHLAPTQPHTEAVSEILPDEKKPQSHMATAHAASEVSEDLRKSLSHMATTGAVSELSEDELKSGVDVASHEKLADKNERALKIKQSTEAILLQVRLTNGKNIRKVFNQKDHLVVVKEFIDDNRDDGNDKYSLAMLYPRKLFSQEDMKKTLLELSLEDRANLIVVASPSEKPSLATENNTHATRSSQITDTSNSGGIWKTLSYLNPFSYFSGATANNESGSSSWQYERTLRQNIERHDPPSSNVEDADASKRNNPPQERKWGGNIHTLQHTENDELFKRGNAFWNGNSTQYGGDDSKQ